MIFKGCFYNKLLEMRKPAVLKWESKKDKALHLGNDKFPRGDLGLTQGKETGKSNLRYTIVDSLGYSEN